MRRAAGVFMLSLVVSLTFSSEPARSAQGCALAKIDELILSKQERLIFALGRSSKESVEKTAAAAILFWFGGPTSAFIKDGDMALFDIPRPSSRALLDAMVEVTKCDETMETRAFVLGVLAQLSGESNEELATRFARVGASPSIAQLGLARVLYLQGKDGLAFDTIQSFRRRRPDVSAETIGLMLSSGSLFEKSFRRAVPFLQEAALCEHSSAAAEVLAMNYAAMPNDPSAAFEAYRWASFLRIANGTAADKVP